MTSDVFPTVIKLAWRFLVNLEVPGLGGSVAAWLVSMFLVGLGIRLYVFAFGLTSGGDSPRTGSTRKPRISDKRKGDTH